MKIPTTHLSVPASWLYSASTWTPGKSDPASLLFERLGRLPAAQGPASRPGLHGSPTGGGGNLPHSLMVLSLLLAHSALSLALGFSVGWAVPSAGVPSSLAG